MLGKLEKAIRANVGAFFIVALCFTGAVFHMNKEDKETSSPTIVPVVEESIVAPSTIPEIAAVAYDPFEYTLTEEELIAAITRNACLDRCAPPNLPVYDEDGLVGMYNPLTHEFAEFSAGERLNL